MEADELKWRFFEQAVSTTRFAVRALTTVCAATLLLIFSGHRVSYSDAAAELERALHVDYEGLLEEVVAKNDPGVRSALSRYRALLGEFGMSVSMAHDRFVFVEMNSEDPVWTIRGGSPLGKVDANFLAVTELRGQVRDITAAEESLRRVLKQARAKIRTGPAVVWLTFSADPATRRTEVRVEWGLGISRGDGVIVTVDQVIGATNFVVPCRLLEELRSSPQASTLIGGKDSKWMFLPATKQIWPEVQDRSATEAREYLARKGAPPEDALNVFGLSIPAGHVAIVAPLLTFGIAIYLLVYIRSLAQAVQESPKFAAYPWIHLMRGWCPVTVSIAIVLALPVITLTATAVHTWNSTNSEVRGAMVSLAVAAIVTLAYGTCALPPVRSAIRKMVTLQTSGDGES